MHKTKYYIYYYNECIEVDKETYNNYDGFKETDIEKQKRILTALFN